MKQTKKASVKTKKNEKSLDDFIIIVFYTNALKGTKKSTIKIIARQIKKPVRRLTPGPVSDYDDVLLEFVLYGSCCRIHYLQCRATSQLLFYISYDHHTNITVCSYDNRHEATVSLTKIFTLGSHKVSNIIYILE